MLGYQEEGADGPAANSGDTRRLAFVHHLRKDMVDEDAKLRALR
jgi:hypothetical protein